MSNCTTKTIYIVGSVKISYCFRDGMPVLLIQKSLQGIEKEIKQEGILRINNFTLINTKFIMHREPGRLITLKGGSIHKVSRNYWKHFM